MLDSNMHDWGKLNGSNVTYVCKKCGVLGHVNKYDLLDGNIKPNTSHKYKSDCYLNIMSYVTSE